MRRFFAVMLALMLALTSLHADAKRLGGGKSIGRQSANVTQHQATPAPATPMAQNPGTAMQQNQAARPAPAPAPAATPQRKPWGAMLGGLAAGLGLAWLAHSLGMGEGFGNMLMVLLLSMGALMAWRMWRSRSAGRSQSGAMAYQGAAAAPASYSPKNVGNDASARPWESANAAFEPAAPAAASAGGSMIGSAIGASALSGTQNWGIPAGFDVEGFLAAAKRNFITLQDAWDRGDTQSLRAMMTDEMLAEIRQQLAERDKQAPGAVNKTEVGMLQAQLLGVEETAGDYLASVEFSGVMREGDSAGPNPFREVWNMSKSKTGGAGWLVAGVQAMQ